MRNEAEWNRPIISHKEIVGKLSTSFESSEAAYAVDRDGVIVMWNLAAEKAFGYPASEALGQRCWKLMGGKDIFGNRCCGKRCSHREMAFQHEPVNGFKAVYKTAIGNCQQFKVSCLTVFDPGGAELLLHFCRPDKGNQVNTVNHVKSWTSRSSHAGVLTWREIQILTLLAEGISTREIASTLFISASTVRNHIQNVLHKLDVHTRLEAVMLSKQLDLI